MKKEQIMHKMFIIFIIGVLNLVKVFGREMTVNIEPGTRDCFYEKVKVGEIIDVFYQVIDGGHGDLDIIFELTEPSGLVIVSDIKQSDNSHTFDAKFDGDYRFCFDNKFSTFNRKTIFFELNIDNPEEIDNDIPDEMNQYTSEERLEVKLETMMDSIGKVKQHLTKARQLQDLLRSYETRDRNLAEQSFNRVNLWSSFQMLLMLIVGSLQVFMVRSLFETNPKVNTIWKKLSL